MRFAAANNFSAADYATAGRAASNSLVNSFAAARRNAPDWTGLARTSMNTRSAERQTAMKAEADVATAGMRAFGNVKDVQIKGAYEHAALKTKLKSQKSRMAGKLGALGGFKMPKPSNKKHYDNMLSKIEGMKQQVPDAAGEISTLQYDPTKSYMPGDGGSSSSSMEFKPYNPDGHLQDSSQMPTNPSSTPVAEIPQQSALSTPKPAGGNTGALNFQSVHDMAAKAGAKFPGIVAAQWQLESGHGTSQLATKHNNLFGQKGAGVSYNTKEDYGNGMVTVNDDFMSFGSPQESVNYLVDRWYKDFGKYKGVNNAGSAAEAANMLKQQGYATDPNYVNKLIDIRNRNMM